MYKYIILIILLLPHITSCNSEIDSLSDPVPGESVVVSFYISGGSISKDSPSTRGVDAATQYENRIDLSQIKLQLSVNSQPLTFKSLNIYQSDAELGIYQVIASVDLPSQYLNQSASYRLEAFANCGNVTTYDTNITHIFDWSLYNPNAGSKVKYIPMWGVMTQNLTLKKGVHTPFKNIHLIRALSKIEISLSESLAQEYDLLSISLNKYNNKGYSLPYNSSNIAETSTSPTQTNIPSDVVSLNTLPFILDGSKAFAYLPENATTSDLNFNINLLNKQLNKVKTYNFNFDFAGDIDFKAIIRNNIYRYKVIRIKDTEELQCSYSIKDWTNKDILINTDDLHWLWVKEDTLYMNNIDRITTIFDSSTEDLVCTISDQKIYTTTTIWPSSQGNATAVATAAQSGDITINSPVPTNFVGKEFLVTVRSNISGKTVTIKVYQFPPLYVSYVKSGTPLQGSDGQINSDMYVFTALLPNLTTIPYPDENDFSRNTWANGVTYTNALRNSSSFGFPQTKSVVYSTANGTFSSTNSAAIASKSYPNSTRVLTTVETVENNLLVSPRFMLASQAGVNIPGSYANRVDWCQRYREYIVANSATDYGPGNWRVPTRSEVYLIDVLQNIKISAVKRILEGNFYWSAYAPAGSTLSTIAFMDWRINPGSTSTNGSVRCVRDIK